MEPVVELCSAKVACKELQWGAVGWIVPGKVQQLQRKQIVHLLMQVLHKTHRLGIYLAGRACHCRILLPG